MLSFAAIVGCGGEGRGYTALDNEAFRDRISVPGVQLVDVRTPEEFGEGHMAGAENIDVQAPDFDLRIMSLDRRSPVAVYCRSGRRSKAAAERFAAAGFEVYELDGGIMNWDGPVVR